MNFKINHGPWETIFEGKLFNHEVEIVMNPDKYFLTIIYDKKDGRRVGALVDGHKALVAKGHMSSFIQSLSKKCIGITKNNGDNTTKMLFVPFKAIYIDFKKEDFVRKIDNELEKSFENINTIIELAKTSSLILKETNMVSEAEYAQILGDPLMARSLLSGLKKTAMEMIDFTSVKTKKEGLKIPLGLNKNREIIKEDVEKLYNTMIIGENKEEVEYAMYILAENFLLENENTIIFDPNNFFEGLGESSKNDLELKENLIEYEPSGFPIKKFRAKETIKTSLKNIDFEIIFDHLKIKDDDLKKKLKEIEKDYNTPKELVEKIFKKPEIGEYQKLKLERILKIIEQKYENLFEKNDNIEEITKKTPGNLGRAIIINTSKLNEKEKMIFVTAILNEIMAEIKENKNIVIFLPETEKIIFQQKPILETLVNSIQNMGIGFVIGTKKEFVELKKNNQTTIQIVNGKDVAVSIKNNRNYRVILRPSLSGNFKK